MGAEAVSACFAAALAALASAFFCSIFSSLTFAFLSSFFCVRGVNLSVSPTAVLSLGLFPFLSFC